MNTLFYYNSCSARVMSGSQCGALMEDWLAVLWWMRQLFWGGICLPFMPVHLNVFESISENRRHVIRAFCKAIKQQSGCWFVSLCLFLTFFLHQDLLFRLCKPWDRTPWPISILNQDHNLPPEPSNESSELPERHHKILCFNALVARTAGKKNERCSRRERKITVDSLHHSYITLLAIIAQQSSSFECAKALNMLPKNALRILSVRFPARWEIMQYSWILSSFLFSSRDQKEQWTRPQKKKLQPHNTGPVPETSTGIVNGVHEILESTSDIFRELKQGLIHSMSLFIVMCVFLLARRLSHAVIVCGLLVVWQK